jgi:hypothetical protein
MANFIYNSGRRLFAEGKIDWLTNAGRPAGSAFTDYKIMAALVNKTGGSILSYSPPTPDSDTAVYTITTSRNMKSDFFWDATTPWTSSPLIRDASGNPITAELVVGTRSFIGATAACSAADITFSNVPVTFNGGAATYGAIEAMVLYLKNESSGATTTGADWPVLAFIDTLSTGAMSITPNGGDIVVQWNASGIFRL